LLTADQTRKAIGSNAANTIDPPYAAILAFPATFLLPLAFGSTFTFRLSAVDDVGLNSSEGPRGADDALREAREEVPVEKAVALSIMAATTKTAAMNLFMINVWLLVV